VLKFLFASILLVIAVGSFKAYKMAFSFNEGFSAREYSHIDNSNEFADKLIRSIAVKNQAKMNSVAEEYLTVDNYEFDGDWIAEGECSNGDEICSREYETQQKLKKKMKDTNY